jgi:hypothetical protein
MTPGALSPRRNRKRPPDAAQRALRSTNLARSYNVGISTIRRDTRPATVLMEVILSCQELYQRIPAKKQSMPSL